jgi:hypothetical protein
MRRLRHLAVPCLLACASNFSVVHAAEIARNSAATEATAATAASSATEVAPQALDAMLDCSANGHAFIAPLLESGAIHARPMHVEDNSVNAFRPVHPLTAWGFPVYVALGWQSDDPLFTHGTGKPIGRWSYGVVVHGSVDEVAARARAADSPATVVRAVALLPFLTAVVCGSPD